MQVTVAQKRGFWKKRLGTQENSEITGHFLELGVWQPFLIADEFIPFNKQEPSIFSVIGLVPDAV